MVLTITFLKEFGAGLWLTLPLLLTLAAGITLLGQFVGRREGQQRQRLMLTGVKTIRSGNGL